jgi:hypothetical protein
MPSTTIPPLAPPGAGLPPLEHFLARALFRLRRATGSRASFTARFHRERERIRVLVSSCDGESGGQRVLIRRPPGLEDSSRYWSVWMTLDHLDIVHRQMVRVIALLASGRTPESAVSTAAVKPSPAADASIVARYEESCDALLAAVESVADLHTATRYAHPWFGPMSAFDWFGLAGGHLRIHRVQIERIVAGLV